LRIFLQPAPLRKRRDVAAQPLSELIPLNEAARGSCGSGGRVGDLGDDDHLIVRSSSRIFFPYRGVRAALSVVFLEPPAVQPRHYAFAPLFQRKFRALFTYDQRMLARCRNAVFFNDHVAFVTPAAPAKTDHMSLISSEKRDLEGHRLRLRVAERHRDRLALYGRAFRPVVSKNEALDRYRFSVAIENSRSPGYFTEKILDCFLTRTVPIYWGDPTIGEAFDARGIVWCRTEGEIDAAVRGLSPEDYDAFAEAIEENFRRASPYTDRVTALAALAQVVFARSPVA
jgi:hypothetical protein